MTDPIYIKKPQGVPESNFMTGEIVYVRDCYPEIYDAILHLLAVEGDDRLFQITVTGTPGIGKSAFYLYFAKRYADDHPDEQLVTAAFSGERKLLRSRLWSSGRQFEARAMESERTDSVHTTKCLHLYDGAPTGVPMPPTKMVCFTCLNTSWLTETWKWAAHADLFMPNWETREVLVANDVLRLGLSETVLSKRMMLFGGTARYVLVKNNRVLKQGVEAIETAFEKVKTIDDVANCFARMPVNPEQVVHSVMHCCITNEDRSAAVLVPASLQVAERLMSAIETSLDNKREQLMKLLDGVGKASTFWGWLFENHAHDTLLRGGSFSIRSLDDSQNSDFEIPATAGIYNRFKLETKLGDIFQDAYRIPDASTLATIDSYAVIGNKLCLFQITRNVSHPISTEGIIGLLEYLHRLDSVRKYPTSVAIIFVVPDEMKQTFSRQIFDCPEVFDGMDRQALLSSTCEKIPGIKREKKRKLEECGIRTVKELLSAHEQNDSSVSFVHAVTEKFRKNMDRLADYQTCKRIPQFVLGMKYAKDSANQTRPSP